MANNLLNQHHGIKPVGATTETIPFSARQIIAYKPGDTVATVRLFENKNAFSTMDWKTLNSKGNATITSARVSTHLDFASQGTVPANIQEWLFTELSNFQFVINDKNYEPMPLADFLPYKLVNIGGSVESVKHTEPNYQFVDAIPVPANDNISLEFVPATGYTAGATDADSPVIFGQEYTVVIIVDIYGSLTRLA